MGELVEGLFFSSLSRPKRRLRLCVDLTSLSLLEATNDANQRNIKAFFFTMVAGRRHRRALSFDIRTTEFYTRKSSLCFFGDAASTADPIFLNGSFIHWNLEILSATYKGSTLHFS